MYRKMFLVSGYTSLCFINISLFLVLIFTQNKVQLICYVIAFRDGEVNTTIYQSSSAAVFILAVLLLEESITIVKVSCCMYIT